MSDRVKQNLTQLNLQFGHVRETIQHVVLQSDAERIAYMESRPWIGYNRARKVLDILTGLMNTAPRSRMPNLLLIGKSNNGKSKLIEHFRDSYPPRSNEFNESIKPVIIAQSPPTAEEKGLYTSILNQFWAPFRTTATAHDLRHQTVLRLRETHVQILIIDEIHSLLTGTAKKQREVMNALKYLCNEVRIPIVGVGTHDAVRVLHSDPQHSSRFSIVELTDWQLDENFQKLVGMFERVLPLRKASELHKLPVVRHLHTISDGNLGNLHELLIRCAKDAIESGKEQITEEIVQANSFFRPTKGFREIVL